MTHPAARRGSYERLAIGAIAALVVLAPAAAGVGAFAGSMSGGGSDSAPTQLADPAE